MFQIFEASYMLLRCFKYNEKYIHLIWYAIHELIMNEFNAVTSDNIKKCFNKYSININCVCYHQVIEEAKNILKIQILFLMKHVNRLQN